ncbi:MAG TPA: methyltransferase domain-containing protein [Chitinophagales bacterium]|nr:methyltransferase domain-containing protein [Chitinophagales bacterium]
MITKQDIINYYEHCEVDYRWVWGLNDNLAMHYGFWDTNTYTLDEALTNINRLLAEKAGIKKTDKVLDAGCGVGGSAVYLAKTIGCHVTGITLSERQVMNASENAAANAVQHLIVFQKQDYTCTGFADGSFDVVWGIESVCYAADKKEFFNEAYRLLNKGGRMVVADFFKTHADNNQIGIYKKFVDGWAVADFAEIDEFINQAEAAGFGSIDAADITVNVAPSAKRLYLASFPGFILHYPLELLGVRNRMNRKNLLTAYLQYVTLKKGLWKYYLVSAVKK